MEKEIRFAALGLLMGGSEARFVSECADILRKYHCGTLARHYMRMPVHKAAERLRGLVAPEAGSVR